MARAYHAGLNEAEVVAAAKRLTAAGSLTSWTLRDLAAELGVAVSVITHHVGSRDALTRCVIEEVAREFGAPDPDVAWTQWFTDMLARVRRVLLRYPGTAKWVMLHGPVFEHLMDTMDAGVATLQRAGFGDRVGYAYSVLFSNAVLSVVQTDERGAGTHAAMRSELLATGRNHSGMAVLNATLFGDFADEVVGEERYFAFVVATTIAGLQSLLEEPSALNVTCVTMT